MKGKIKNASIHRIGVGSSPLRGRAYFAILSVARRPDISVAYLPDSNT